MKINQLITEKGKWSSDVIETTWVDSPFTDRTNINAATIFSELIRETGRICESYASDLLHFIDHMKRRIENVIIGWDYANNDLPMSFTAYIGLRKHGVSWFVHADDESFGDRLDKYLHDPDYFVRLTFRVEFNEENELVFSLLRRD